MIPLGVVLFYVVPALVLAEVLRCIWLEHRRDRIPILLYHRLISRTDVAAGRTPDNEPIYASYDDVFERQMRHLADQRYETLSLDDLLAIRRGERPLPARAVVITLDDGYESNYTMAWPILRRLGLKATIFVPPEPDDYTRNLVAGFDGFLTGDQMRELDRGGVAIESHTLTHCVLSDLDDGAARHELAESRRRLAAIVGRPIRHLSVPRSGSNIRVRRLIREAGYLTACSNGKGSSNGWSSLHALPRIVIERDTSLEDFSRALGPPRAVVLRLVGTLKRVPAVLFGSVRAQRFRKILFAGPLRGLFLTRSLMRLLAGAALAYGAAVLWFTWYLASR
jgi:peptidoglycan/xylan/chitin deacetylase (PgdA/CDA1 family)